MFQGLRFAVQSGGGGRFATGIWRMSGHPSVQRALRNSYLRPVAHSCKGNKGCATEFGYRARSDCGHAPSACDKRAAGFQKTRNLPHAFGGPSSVRMWSTPWNTTSSKCLSSNRLRSVASPWWNSSCGQRARAAVLDLGVGGRTHGGASVEDRQLLY